MPKGRSDKTYRRRFNLSEKEVELRMQYQMPESDKINKADFVIDNSGSLEETKQQVVSVRKMILKNQIPEKYSAKPTSKTPPKPMMRKKH